MLLGGYVLKHGIDFIITWVDDSDPAWQKERNKYMAESAQEDSRSVRFRDTDTLRYWFRESSLLPGDICLSGWTHQIVSLK